MMVINGPGAIDVSVRLGQLPGDTPVDIYFCVLAWVFAELS
jgi:hypothetical protein